MSKGAKRILLFVRKLLFSCLSKNIRSPSSTTTLKVENHYREILRFAITKCVMYESLFFSFLSLYIQHEIRYCSSKCKATKALEHS